MATGHPPIFVSDFTYAPHNSRSGYVFLRKRHTIAIGVRLFQECSYPTSDQIDSFLSQFDAWDRDITRPYSFEYYDMTAGHVVRLDGRRVTIVKGIPIEIGFGDDIFPSLVMRKIDDMQK